MFYRRVGLAVALLVCVLVAGPVMSAVLTVTTQADSGAGSLRDAIDSANLGGADQINFAAGMSGKTIHVQSDLPTLTDDDTSIDGDINNDGKPDVAISGDQAAISNGLTINSADNTIHGLCINTCGYGIYFNGSGAHDNLVTSCHIGTNLTGQAPLPNDNYGIYINYGNNNTIGGLTAATRNVISGNYNNGIYVYHTRGTVIRNAYIGLNAAGTGRIPNSGYGIYGYYSANTTIGAANAAAKTVISGNYNGGIVMYYSSGVKLINSYLGTNPAGTAAIANNGTAIYLFTCNQAKIGGTAALEPNLISGNNGTGVYAANAYSGPTIQGNSIGTNLAGGGALPNNGNGVQLSYCSNPIVGGGVTAARNLISGNESTGVYLDNCTGGNVKGNYIGVVKTGNAELRNAGDGVYAGNCTTLNVGGATAAERNVICVDSTGVRLVGSRANANNVVNNYIGYGANGTTALPVYQGINVSAGVRSSNIGTSGKGNRILATNEGVGFSRVGSGCQAISNRIGAPIGTPACGSTGISVDRGSPTIDGNTVFQQESYALYINGATALPIVKNNILRRNGIACYISTRAQPNLGNLGNVATNDNGNNTFTGSSGYDIENRSTYDIKAEGNTFITTSAEAIDARLIFDKLDNALYGRVDYAPLKSGAPTVPAPAGMTVAAAPTRSGGAQIVISLASAGDLTAEVLNVAGRSVRLWSSVQGKAGTNTLLWDGKSGSGLAVPSGAYLISVTCRSQGGAQQRQMARVQLSR